MRCPVCGGENAGRSWRGVGDSEYGTYRPVDYVSCSRCGTITQLPLPPAELIPSFYPADYRNHTAAGSGLFAALKRMQARQLARRIRRHIGGADKKVLEIGCGSGALLVALRDLGFRDLAGADFDTASEATLARHGIRFRSVNIEQEFPFAESFDAVLMVNVIEHFLDPASVLRRARGHLAAGGTVILITPNAAALDLAIFGRFWSGFHAPRHIVLFSRRGLERLARAAGFSGAAVWPFADPAQWAISVQNALQASRMFRRRLTSGLAWYTAFLALGLVPLAWLQNLWPRRSTAMLAVSRIPLQ